MASYEPQPPPVQTVDGTDRGGWSNGFCDCCSPMGTCCCAFWGPCCLYGKTDSRLRDPQLKDGRYCSSGCALYTFISILGFHWIPLMMKRTEIRDRFHIRGSCCGDYCAALCCSCCVLVQNEKEVDARSNAMATSSRGYQQTTGMVYYPQY